MSSDSARNKFFIQCINGFIVIFITIVVVGIPFAAKSLYDEVVSNASDTDRFMLIESGKSGDYIQIEMVAKELDPVNKVMKFDVSGFHGCGTTCNAYALKLHVSSFYKKESNENRVPESLLINIPAGNSEFEQEIELPVGGVIYEYPYDRYLINVAIAVEKVTNGKSIFITAADNYLNVMIDEQTAKLQDVSHNTIADLNTITTEHPPTVAFTSEFARPFYVKYIVTLLVILLVITTAATVFLSEFSKLITGSAGIIFGVWGARTLLLGSLPADVTIIDIILTLIVIGTLVSVAIKSMLFVRKRLKE